MCVCVCFKPRACRNHMAYAPSADPTEALVARSRARTRDVSGLMLPASGSKQAFIFVALFQCRKWTSYRTAGACALCE